MLLEGVPAPSIEQASNQAGYPAPVLQLTDELNLELSREDPRRAHKDAIEVEGGTFADRTRPSPSSTTCSRRGAAAGCAAPASTTTRTANAWDCGRA